MQVLLQGGHLFDPTTNIDGLMDLRIRDGILLEVGSGLVPEKNETIIDCSGLWIAPGLVDVCTFCGELGDQHREDFSSLTRAALTGGYTDIVLGPIGTPCVDNPAVVTDLLARSARYSVRYHCLGSLTKALLGEELAELGLMKRAGVVGFSDGGHPIASSLVFRRALQYAERLGLPVFLTPSDSELRTEGVMHEGVVSTQIGLRGIPLASEQISVRRIEALTQDTGVISCTLPIGDAQNNLSSLRTGVSARSLLLSDADLELDLYNPSLHIEPPLRSNPQGLIEAISNGEIDLIFSHHTPLTRVEKDCEFAASVPGAMGLETALSAAYTALGDLRVIWQTMCFAPAALCHLSKGLHLGANVDIIIFDPKHEWVPSKPYMSKGINEPFEGRKLLGKVLGTLIGSESFADTVRKIEVNRKKTS